MQRKTFWSLAIPLETGFTVFSWQLRDICPVEKPYRQSARSVFPFTDILEFEINGYGSAVIQNI
jgi:hypothetical protein